MTWTAYCCGRHLGTLSPAALEALAASCDDEEHARAARFVFREDRNAYLAAHGLLRHTLSALCPDRDPGGWAFQAATHGKPHLKSGLTGRDLRFNLSHCRSRVVCIVTEGLDCGIDVEPASRPTGDPGLYASCLTPEEAAWLDEQPHSERSLAFLKLWTLKEAVTKSIGLGLHFPFQQVALEVRALPRLRAVAGHTADRFWLAQTITDDHVETVAVVMPAPSRTPVTVQRIACPY